MPRRPLLEAVRDPGFTPSVRDADALVDMLADDVLWRDAQRAIVRLGADGVPALTSRMAAAAPGWRARVVRVLGRLAGDPRAAAALRTALDDRDPRTRRAAATALGRSGAGSEDDLLRAWQADARPEMRRAVAAALGKVGTTRALHVLNDASTAQDPELARLARHAARMIERTASRATRGHIDGSRAPAAPVEVLALCRRGLEELLADELLALDGLRDVRVAGAGSVHARLAGPLEALFAARTLLDFRFSLPAEWLHAGEPAEDAVVRALTSPRARRIFEAWTDGDVRYRIAWADGARRRAATWSLADAVTRAAPDLVNDPTESLWEVVVGTGARSVDVALAPRIADPRFTWRAADVPAASHPTIAAALARVAGAREDDVVWDPFVGSGQELVERARLGPYRELHGSDRDERALAAARANLARAGVAATIEQADALRAPLHGATLVITNPPMGRRASRTAGLDDLLDRFVAYAAASLAPTGRLVWIAPWPDRARAAAARTGLALGWARTIDMGGFDAELQRWNKSS